MGINKLTLRIEHRHYHEDEVQSFEKPDSQTKLIKTHVLYRTVQYSTVQYSTVQYSTVMTIIISTIRIIKNKSLLPHVHT